MRRIAAGTAVTLLSMVTIAGPLATVGHAGSSSLRCAVPAPPAACSLLDDLAAQLAPIAPLVAPAAPSVAAAQGLAARSDQSGGVPTAEVVQVSQALLGQLAALPASVETLVGATRLGAVTGTLQSLVGQLTAPAPQQSSGGSAATPARSSGTSGLGTVSSGRSDTSSFGGSASTSASSSSSSPSSASVPDVPAGDPLTLSPLALPDFGFDQSFEPAVVAPAAASTEDVALAEAIDELSDESRAPELVVVAVLSLLLLGGAGVAQLQANRRQILD
jgi:hypothetical protein